MSVDLHEKETNGAYRHDSVAEDTESFLFSDRKLIRRIDWHLLPWICILYALSLVDRSLVLIHSALIVELILVLPELREWRRNLKWQEIIPTASLSSSSFLGILQPSVCER